jgi:hypothetical protein
VNADAELDPLVLRHVDILFGHAALNFGGTSHGVDHAGELSNSAVPGILDDASVMLSDFGIKKSSPKRLQSCQRAFFVYPYQAARARDIRRQNSRQSPLYVLAAQDGPPCSGTLSVSVYIAQLSAMFGYAQVGNGSNPDFLPSLGAAPPLPPSADIGPGGQSVG